MNKKNQVRQQSPLSSLYDRLALEADNYHECENWILPSGERDNMYEQIFAEWMGWA